MRDAQATKHKIERAALRLFVEQGIAETSIRDIAREAGISQGAMYVHYPSKEELAWRLFSEGFSEFGRELRRRAHEQGSLTAKLRAMINHVFERFDEDWLEVSYVFLARHAHLKRVSPRLGNPYISFRAVIADAMVHGEIPRQDPELAATFVVGAVIQVIDTRILGRIDGPLADLAEPTTAACARLLQA